MKKNLKATKPCSNQYGRPTLLDFISSYHAEAAKMADTTSELDPKIHAKPLPEWGVKTLVQLRKTVMKPVLNLKPKPNCNCLGFGKIIGVLERQITFLEVDIWEIIQAEGLDKITPEQWEKIQPEAQMRAYLSRVLKRKIRDEEITDDLANEALTRKIEHLKEIRQKAFDSISTKGAKDRAMFYKGLAQGYELFLDTAGNFCGDRGRTEIYTELLSSQYEIEKMRRTLPPKNDDDLYEHLKPWYAFPGASANEHKEWLRDVCDDISLYITGKRGRRAGILKKKTSPIF